VTVPVIDAQPLITALAAALSAQGVAFGEGKKPTVAAGSPYIVGWFDSGTIENRSLRSRDGWSTAVVLQSYGSTPESVRIAVRKGRAAVFSLFGQAVGSRTVLMPEHLSPMPMQRDDDADPPIFWQSDEWRIRTTA
jgi:hypothetical protein